MRSIEEFLEEKSYRDIGVYTEFKKGLPKVIKVSDILKEFSKDYEKERERLNKVIRDNMQDFEHSRDLMIFYYENFK